MHLFNSLYNNDLIERPADHPSLVIDRSSLTSNVPISDTVRRFHPFSDVNNLRPTYLGLHKRLVSNPADRLQYDIQYTADPLIVWMQSGSTRMFMQSISLYPLCKKRYY